MTNIINRCLRTSRAVTWLVALTPYVLRADVTQPVTADNYFVTRLTSPLQRVLLGSADDHNLTTYAEIDASSLATSLQDVKQLRSTLADFSKLESPNASLLVRLHFGSDTGDGQVLFYDLMEVMATRVGFKHVKVLGRSGLDHNWKTLRILPRPDGDEQASEENIGNNVVSVFLVQTALSRRLTDEASCYVHISIPPADKWTNEYLTVIVAAASRVQPNQRNRVVIQVTDLNASGFELPAHDVAKALHEAGYNEVVVGIQQGATNRLMTLRRGE